MISPKVSVIVPVFRAGDYIARAVESLTGQELDDMEFIFVDDCGGDGSMATVEEYASGDERIRTLYNEVNQGSGASRNRGIEAARGEYLAFLDPDDYVGSDYYRLLYECAKAHDVDIAKGTRSLLRSDGSQDVESEQDHLNARIAEGLAAGKPLYALFTYQHTTAIFRRELIMRSGARYGSSRNAQDTTFLLRLCYWTQSIALEPRARYFYCFREGSAVHTYTERRTQGEILALTEKLDFVVEQGLDDEYARDYVQARLRNILSYQASMLDEPGNEEQANELLGKIREQAVRGLAAQDERAIMPSMRALVRYGVNICKPGSVAGFVFDPWVPALSWMRRCVSFVSEDPETRAEYAIELDHAVGAVLALAALDDLDADLCRALQEAARDAASSVTCLQAVSNRPLIVKALVEDDVNLHVRRAPASELPEDRCERMLECADRWLAYTSRDREHAETYLEGLAHYLLRSLTAHLGVTDPERSRELLGRMRETALGYADGEALASQSVYIRALMEHEANIKCLPREGYETPGQRCERLLDCITRWSGFVTEDVDGRLAYLPELAKLMKRLVTVAKRLDSADETADVLERLGALVVPLLGTREMLRIGRLLGLSPSSGDAASSAGDGSDVTGPGVPEPEAATAQGDAVPEESPGGVAPNTTDDETGPGHEPSGSETGQRASRRGGLIGVIRSILGGR